MLTRAACAFPLRLSAQLIEAEKTFKRAAKTTDTYKQQVTKLNPTGAMVAPKRSVFSGNGRGGGATLASKKLDKNLQVTLMEKELEALRDGIKNKGSKACTIS